jgi:hypothetical protein
VHSVVLLISYDLNGHERPSSYEAVHGVINGNSISFKHPLYSQWFVETEMEAQAWSDLIGTVTDEGDSWFVLRVTRPYQGWFPSDVWEWLRARM